MPYNSKERLEHEARESLVAADLGAKMKQWRDQKPPPKGNGGPSLRILLVLLALGGAAWLFWPKTKVDSPAVQPPAVPTQQPKTEKEIPEPEEPVAQKSPPTNKQYLALAQSNYHAPDFASEIRGENSNAQDALNTARRALAEQRYADALDALQNTSNEYKTDAAYLRGHALFGQKKYAQAATVFAQLTGSIRYGEAAQWYELLSLVPDFEQSKPLVLKKLKRISDDEGHTFHREGETLLKALNRKM